MKRSLFTFLCFVFASMSQAQNWNWDSIVSPGAGFKFCKDKIYGLYNYNMNTIQKLHPAGGMMWQLTLHPKMTIRNLETFGDGSFYVTGEFADTCFIGTDTLVSMGAEDIWLAHFSAGGSLLWLKGGGSPYKDICGEICMLGNSLVMTGALSDTAVFLGYTVPKAKNLDLFVAILTASGTIQAFKVAAPVPTSTLQNTSSGYECAVDPSGNIYVFGYAGGKALIDTLSLSNQFSGAHSLIIKFNTALQPQWKYSVGIGGWYSPHIYDLNVNSSGECFYVKSISYNQSGAGVETSTIYKLGAVGSGTAGYHIPSGKKGWYSDIDLDGSDNLYFTGYHRSSSPQPLYVALVNGRLNSNLQVDWIRLDTATQYRKGMALVAFGENDCYIGGVFTGTLHLASTMYSGYSGNPIESFHAHLFDHNLIGLNELSKDEFFIYPNPVNDQIRFSGNFSGKVQIINVAGQIILQEEITDNTRRLDLSELPQGSYVISGQSMRSKFVKKFVKL